MRAPILACIALLQSLSVGNASAQAAQQATNSRMRDAGLALGVAGYLAGSWLGAKAYAELRRERGDDLRICGDDCGATGAIILGALGGSTGVAAGVHWTNHSRGDFSREWLASLGIGALGTGVVVLVAQPWNQQPPGFWKELLLTATYLVGIPALQLVATIHIERETAQQNHPAAEPRPLFTVRVPLAW